MRAFVYLATALMFGSCQLNTDNQQTPEVIRNQSEKIDSVLLIREAKATLESAPNNGEALLLLTQYYATQQLPDKALSYAERLAEIDSSFAHDSLLLKIYIDLALYEKALELSQLSRQSTTSTESSLQHAQLLQKAGYNHQSNLMLDSLLKNNIQPSSLFLLKGINFIAIGDTGLACANFEQSAARGEILNDSIIQLLCPQIIINTE